MSDGSRLDAEHELREIHDFERDNKHAQQAAKANELNVKLIVALQRSVDAADRLERLTRQLLWLTAALLVLTFALLLRAL
jgi:hypothetical protein